MGIFNNIIKIVFKGAAKANMGIFNIIILCLFLNLMFASGHPEDIECFEENFPSNQDSDFHYGLNPQNYQQINIKHILYHGYPNKTTIKTETVKLSGGEKKTLTFESQEPSLNPRTLTLFYDEEQGHMTKAAIGYYHRKTNSSGNYENWTCSTVHAKAPESKLLIFSNLLDIDDNSSFAVDLDVLELGIIQSDVSCFEENFPEMINDDLEQDKCGYRNHQVVHIQHIVNNDKGEAIFKEIRETLVKGEKKFVELTSQTTDILNPRYLIMFFDGALIQASISEINHPGREHCQTFNDSAPNSLWSPKFANNYDNYYYDELRVEFLDPEKPWGNEKDLECYEIQFPDCGTENKSKDGPKNASIYVSHYYQTNLDSVAVDTLLVNVTEGIDKIVNFEYRHQSDVLDENTRNLTLSLVGSNLNVGIGQLHDNSFGHDWTCLNSSLRLPLGSEEKKEMMFYEARYWKDSKYVLHREFLSFSWNEEPRNHATRTYLSFTALCISIIILQ